MLKAVILLDSKTKNSWWSWPQLINAIVEDWIQFFQKENVEFKIIDVSKLVHMDGSSSVIIPQLSIECLKKIKKLRATGFAGRLIIHDQGDINYISQWLREVQPSLQPQDQFVYMSNTISRLARAVFPKGNLSIYQPRLKIHQSPVKKNIPHELIYFGRVSAQKNIHGLLLSMLWLKTTKLTLYGPVDSLGTPQLGIKYPRKKYLKLLNFLIKEFKLQKQVQFKDKIPRAALLKKLAQKNFTFVSPSLHYDENFGTSVAETISLGRGTVTSRWGGLQDWGKRFPNQSICVPVQMGPSVNPYDFAMAVRNRPKNIKKNKAGGNESLKAIWKYRPKKNHSWEYSSFANNQAFSVLSFFKNSPSRTFISPRHPLCQRYFNMMGMKAKIKKGKGCFYLYPWVQAVGTNFVSQDPILGTHQIAIATPNLKLQLQKKAFGFWAQQTVKLKSYELDKVLSKANRQE